ncbi:hypothetical protein RINTHH_14360 [Richelia intracellularis HH01]|jgi:hypothetical protein|uniref:Uncharacterized protein n=1 Tax=Richelia intracellularis HH01 TaxID=1165094 RepID=M1X5T0_9NOST|nr:hypothetical protein [Richelia intracellularis]CCH67591.1 hypothetical protein RINTHH_14360 [Richelia intracellularis HH01]
MKDNININCQEFCIKGCILGDECPNIKYQKATSQFIQDTPLDKILEIAQASRLKKRIGPPRK